MRFWQSGTSYRLFGGQEKDTLTTTLLQWTSHRKIPFADLRYDISVAFLSVNGLKISKLLAVIKTKFVMGISLLQTHC